MKASAFLFTLLGGAALLAQAPAMASDMGLPPEFRTGTFDIYVGTFVATNGITSEYDDVFAEETHDLDGTALGWGVRGGVDYRYGNWVFGVVGDGNFGQTIAQDDKLNTSLDMPVLGTLRARAGGEWGNTMVYLTGGYALAEMQLKAEDNDFDGTEWAHGWTMGVGANYALTNSFSVGLEYLYISLGDVEYPSGEYEQNFGPIQTIRLGLDYRFHI